MRGSRGAVLRVLAAATDAEAGETVSVSTLADAVDADESAVRRHLAGLAACHLARVDAESRVRVTVTGEELLALDPDGEVVVGLPEESGG